MADRKISELTALTTPATGDLIPIVDISEAAAADKNKKITVGELLRGAPDGTAAAPGFAFESDGGNGMFLGGTDILAFSTGGSQAVTIDASQRVGIGTASPGANLQIQDDSSFSLVRVVGSSSSVAGIDFGDTADTDTGGVRYDNVTDSMAFRVNTSERARLDASGRLLVGTSTVITSASTTTSGLGLNITPDGGLLSKTTQTVGSIFFEQNITGYTSGTVIYQRFRIGGTSVGTISSTNGTSTSYNTSSDYRLKENVVPLTGAADRLNQLQVHRFNFIADPDTTVDGFIAHEAQAVVPECVTGTKDEVDDDGNPVYQGIDQSKLVPLLTAALQEAVAKIETLEARITALEGN